MTCEPCYCPLPVVKSLNWHGDDIIEKSCEYLNVPLAALKSKTRTRNLVESRHMIMVLLREQAKYSLKDIGRVFNRDHTTVIHARETVESLCFSDRDFKKRFHELRNYVNKVA